MKINAGKCFCGSSAYEFRGDPVNSAYCYCHTCQFFSNSDHWFGLWVPADAFDFNGGNLSSFSRTGDSGMEVVHHFCADCGTVLALYVDAAQIYSVAASTVTGEPWLRPDLLIYTAHARPGTAFPEGVQRFEILPPELDGSA